MVFKICVEDAELIYEQFQDPRYQDKYIKLGQTCLNAPLEDLELTLQNSNNQFLGLTNIHTRSFRPAQGFFGFFSDGYSFPSLQHAQLPKKTLKKQKFEFLEYPGILLITDDHSSPEYEVCHFWKGNTLKKIKVQFGTLTDRLNSRYTPKKLIKSKETFFEMLREYSELVECTVNGVFKETRHKNPNSVLYLRTSPLPEAKEIVKIPRKIITPKPSLNLPPNYKSTVAASKEISDLQYQVEILKLGKDIKLPDLELLDLQSRIKRLELARTFTTPNTKLSNLQERIELHEDSNKANSELHEYQIKNLKSDKDSLQTKYKKLEGEVKELRIRLALSASSAEVQSAIGAANDSVEIRLDAISEHLTNEFIKLENKLKETKPKKSSEKESEDYLGGIEKLTGLTTSFDDIGGQKKAKETMMDLCLAIKNPELFLKHGTKPAKGGLLWGPPRTGKTLLAKATASEAGVPFFHVKCSKIHSRYYGDSEKGLQAIFDAANEEERAIIFLDELDALAPSRNEAHEASARVVAVLLENMDGIGSKDSVTVIGATNRLESIDEALTSAGRMDVLIEVPLPDEEGRYQIFNIHKSKAEKLAENTLFADLDYDLLVSKTEDKNGADIKEYIRRALFKQVKEEISSGKEPALLTTDDLLFEITGYERNTEERVLGFVPA